MMSDQLDWTEKLGDAVLAQQADVMDAVQRLRAEAQANGKLETTKQQKVTVNQEATKQVIEIAPASSGIVYVPYYDPAIVYGAWPYPDYPPYYYPPPAGYIYGGAIARGLAWGAAFAIGNEIWDNIDWDRGDINVNIDRNVNRNAERNFTKWEHNSYHRRGVSYNSDAVRNKYAKGNARAAADRNLDRGRKGEQGLTWPRRRPIGGGNLGERPKVNPNIGQGGGQLGGGNLAGKAKTKPNVGQLEQGLKERSGKAKGQVAGKAKAKAGGGGNALDLSDGAWAKDFSDRGKASLGNRGAKDFARPSGPRVSHAGRGGGHNFNRGSSNRPHVSRGGGGGRPVSAAVAAVDAAAVGGVPTSTSNRTSYRSSSSKMVSSFIASAIGTAIPHLCGRHGAGREEGRPERSWRARDGYLRVDYDRIGVKFMTWKEWLARGGASSSSSP